MLTSSVAGLRYFQNIVKNQWKKTPRGPIIISISRRKRSEPKKVNIHHMQNKQAKCTYCIF